MSRFPVGAFSLVATFVLGCSSGELTETPPAVVGSVVVTPYAKIISVGDTLQLVVTLRDAKGNWIGNRTVSWTSSDPLVASVSASGKVTALIPGSVLITAECEGVRKSANITVLLPPVATPVNFVVTGGMSTPRLSHTATLLDNGTVLIAGGSDDRSAEIYDPSTGRFSRTGDMTVARRGAVATKLADGRVLILGGSPPIEDGTTGEPIASGEIYDPATRSFAPTGSMLEPAVYFTATLLLDGNVLIAGGVSEPCYPCRVLRAELYHPSTGQFTMTGSYAQTGSVFIPGGPYVTTATRLQNGQVLLAGHPRAEIYDPPTGAFLLAAPMMHTEFVVFDRPSTLLANGKVLFVAGVDDWNRFSDAEIFDPATGSFSPAGQLSLVRSNHTVTLLLDGRVLVAAGESIECNQPTCGVDSTPTAELYDPVSGRWSYAGQMSTERESHTATRLRDGRVLVTGGLRFHGGLFKTLRVTILSSAELYIPPASPSASHPH